MTKARYINMRPRKGGRARQPKDVGDLLARELKRIEACAKDLAQAKRRLTRARMRYSVLKRLATNPLFKADLEGTA